MINSCLLYSTAPESPLHIHFYLPQNTIYFESQSSHTQFVGIDTVPASSRRKLADSEPGSQSICVPGRDERYESCLLLPSEHIGFTSKYNEEVSFCPTNYPNSACRAPSAARYLTAPSLQARKHPSSCGYSSGRHGGIWHQPGVSDVLMSSQTPFAAG